MLCVQCSKPSETRSKKLRASICSTACTNDAKAGQKFVQVPASSPIINLIKKDPVLVALSSGAAHSSVDELRLPNGSYSIRRIVAEPLQRHCAATPQRAVQFVGAGEDDDDSDSDSAGGTPTLQPGTLRLTLPMPGSTSTPLSAAAAAATVAPAPSWSSPSQSTLASMPRMTLPTLGSTEMTPEMVRIVGNPDFNPAAGGQLPYEVIAEMLNHMHESERVNMLSLPQPWNIYAARTLTAAARLNINYIFRFPRSEIPRLVQINYSPSANLFGDARIVCATLCDVWVNNTDHWLDMRRNKLDGIYYIPNDKPVGRFMNVVDFIVECSRLAPDGATEFLRTLLATLVGKYTSPDPPLRTDKIACASFAPALAALHSIGASLMNPMTLFQPPSTQTAASAPLFPGAVVLAGVGPSLYPSSPSSKDTKKEREVLENKMADVVLLYLRLLGDPLLRAIPYTFRRSLEGTEPFKCLMTLIGRTALEIIVRNALLYIAGISDIVVARLLKSAQTFAAALEDQFRQPDLDSVKMSKPIDDDLRDGGFAYAIIAHNELGSKAGQRGSVIGDADVAKALLYCFSNGMVGVTDIGKISEYVWPKIAEESVSGLSFTDPLTGLLVPLAPRYHRFTYLEAPKK